MKDEALRLAEYHECATDLHSIQTAAELRRLHAENEAFGIHLSERMKDLATVEAQRDALLAALKLSRAQWIHSVNSDHCLAAIKQAEENT